MKNLVCPHCDSQVSERAQVCIGCGAEIVRGATRGERSGIGMIFALLALVVGLVVLGSSHPPAPNTDAALFVFLGLVGFVVVGYLFGTVIARLLRRSKLRFLRSYDYR